MDHIAHAVGATVLAIFAWHLLGIASTFMFGVLILGYERWRNENPHIVAADNFVVVRAWEAIHVHLATHSIGLALLVTTAIAPLLLLYGMLELEWRLLDHTRRRILTAAGIPVALPHAHPNAQPGPQPHA